MRPTKLKVFLLYAAVCFIWGSTWLAIKLGLDGVPPFLGAGVRFTVAGLAFIIPILSARASMRLGKRDLGLIAVVGTLNFGVSYGLVYLSEQVVSSGLASVLFSVYPLFVVVLARYWYRLEDLDVRKMTGILLGFLGVVLIYLDEIRSSSSSLGGMLALLVASLASGVSLVYLKKHGSELNTLVLNFYSMLWGAGLLLLGTAALERGIPVRWSGANIAALMYLAIFGSVCAFTIYFYLLKHLSASQMSYVGFVCPAVAVILGAWVLHEKLSGNMLIGAILVLAGIFISSRARLRPEKGAH